MIVSAGMTGVQGLVRAQRVLQDAGGGEFAALHCVSAYPTPPEAARLATIPVLARELGATIGYSDHTIGVDACLAAVALGARILEKHFTLGHDFSDFRDHQLSAEPAELQELVKRVAEVELLRGEPRDMEVLPEEVAVAAAARRSAVAARDLPEGHRSPPRMCPSCARRARSARTPRWPEACCVMPAAGANGSPMATWARGHDPGRRREPRVRHADAA